MQVNAINSIQFLGRSSKTNKKAEIQNKQTNPIEREITPGQNVSNKSMRDAAKAMALAMFLVPVASPMMQSCSDDIDIKITDIHNVHPSKTDTLYIPVWQKPDTVWRDKIVRDTIYLPGDTIVKTDTISYPVYIPGDTILVPRKYTSEVFDIMKDMMDEVDIKTEGEGDLITRMIGTDEWGYGSINVYNLNGKKSSEERPVFDVTTYHWDENLEKINESSGMTYGELGVSESGNGGLFLEHKVPRGSAFVKPSTQDGYKLDKETVLTKGEGLLYRKDITNGEVDKGTIRKGDKPQSVFFHEPYGEIPENELVWRWSDIAVKLGESPDDADVDEQ